MAETPRLVSIQVGQPRTYGIEGAAHPLDRPWTTSFGKRPVAGAVWVGRANLDGDAQADRKHHGGPDKAVLAYSADHYPLWRDELGMADFPYGAFAENLTIAGLAERQVHIGDILEIGAARFQVSQPRQPCWKISRFWRVEGLTARVQETLRTGWYLRVLREGWIEAGQPVVLVERPLPEWPVERANILMHRRKQDREAAAELAASPLLAASWRATLAKRAATGENPPTRERLIGAGQG